MKITMHSNEVELFTHFLSQSNAYFEFGMGGSTFLAASLVKDYICAIDSDQTWVDMTREEILNAGNEADLRFVDIGPTAGWGTPTGRSSEHLFDAYSKSIVNSGYKDFDLCLVDGRFRVACFLQSIQHLRSDSVIAIHDYKSRPHYHLVEDFGRPISSCQQLTFFVKRQGIDHAKLDKILQMYRRNHD